MNLKICTGSLEAENLYFSVIAYLYVRFDRREAIEIVNFVPVKACILTAAIEGRQIVSANQTSVSDKTNAWKLLSLHIAVVT